MGEKLAFFTPDSSVSLSVLHTYALSASNVVFPSSGFALWALGDSSPLSGCLFLSVWGNTDLWIPAGERRYWPADAVELLC